MTLPYLKFFFRKSDDPQEPNVDRETYDTLSGYEPRHYPPNDESYVRWREFKLQEYTRMKEHYNCGGLEVGKIGVDPAQPAYEQEILAIIEAREDFVRWV